MKKAILVLVIAIVTVSFLAPTVKALNTDSIKAQITQLQKQIVGLQEQLTGTCHNRPLWDWHYCTSLCPCDAGEGDCDLDSHCNNGKCALDSGEKYGQSKWVDVCEGEVILEEVVEEVEAEEVAEEVVETETALAEQEVEPSFTLSLADTTPLTQAVSFGSKEAAFLDVLVSPDNDNSDVLYSLKACFFSIKEGVSSSAGRLEIYNIRLYDGEDRVGFKDRIGSDDGCAVFSDLNWDVASSTSKVLTVKGDILKNTGTEALFAEVDGIVGNVITNTPPGSLSVSLSSDTPDPSSVKLGTMEAPVFKFIIDNPLDEIVFVERLSLALEGSLEPDDLGAVTWKVDGEVLGESYFGSAGANYGLASIFNLSGSPIFYISANSAAEIEALVDVKEGATVGNNFQFSLLEEFYIDTISNHNIVGFPLKSNNFTIITDADCYDSDGGINEYTLGKALKDGYVNYDACVFKYNLKEWICTKAGDKLYKLIDCPEGCIDGVCKKVEGNDESSGIVCIDSDGGKDFHKYGSVEHGAGDVIDNDACESETILKETFCDNGYYSYESYDCPEGCSDGACLKQTAFDEVEDNLASIAEKIKNILEKFKSLFK